jgi:riboflavin kinase/FMN adenylyltransferase
VTFDPHPRRVVTGEPVGLLTTIAERADALDMLGIGRLVVLPFNRDVASWPAERFVREVLVGRLGARRVVVGHDHGFGRQRAGGVDLMRQLGGELGFEVTTVDAHAESSIVVSSTKIRDALGQGRVSDAAHLLGRPYRLIGRVERGDRRGRTLGFPTANLVPDLEKVLPQFGVYACDVQIDGGGETHRAAVNVGVRPTFDLTTPLVEVHLIGFEGDLYGRTLAVDFVRRIRDERRFDGVEALKAQLRDDVRRCTNLD